MTRIHEQLIHLEAVGLIRLVQTHPELEYLFRHALLQEVAYRSLLREDRKKLHCQVGEAMEEVYPGRLEELASELGRHFGVAEDFEKALYYLHLAGKRSVRQSANQEAITYFNQALTFLEKLPDTPERVKQELDLQLALGNALVAVRGYAAPEVGQAFSRARELSMQAMSPSSTSEMEEISQQAAVLQGLHRYYLVRGELSIARDLGEQLLNLAQNTQDPNLLPEAHRVMGTTLWFLGEFASSLEHFREGLVYYDSRQHPSYILLYGQDPGVTCLSYIAWALWILGYPDQALQRSQELLTLAQKLAHPFSLAYALIYAVGTHVFRREVHAAQKQAEAAMALSTEQGFAPWIIHGTIFQGWISSQQGRDEEGITQMREGLAAWWATGARLGGHFSAFLAEAYGKVAQAEEGLGILSETFVMVKETGEHFWEAELYRVKGELLLTAEGREMKDEDDLSPEAYFLKAIDIARQQSAKSLELRAVTSLARLWYSQGAQRKKEEARQMLAEIYDWFTEGFDTLDLIEAKALLEELS